MSLVLSIIAFTLASLYAVASSVYAFKLSRKLEGKHEWYPLLLMVQQHTLIGAQLEGEVKGQQELPEYIALKRVIRTFYATFIPVLVLAFISNIAGW